MTSFLAKLCVVALLATAPVSVLASRHASACVGLTVINDGEPAGEIKKVDGIDMYHSYPPNKTSSSNTAILHVTDIFGVPLLQNKLLADSIARAGYLVILPDLFHGDAVPSTDPEATLNLTAWRTRHPQSETETVVNSTIKYMREKLSIARIGAVGYCWGGKYVPRFLAQGNGIDVGFIAHPSNLEASEIQAIAGPISIAAGELDGAFNSTLRRNAEDILQRKNATYQTTVYSGAPHGFGVRVNQANLRERYAKESAFFQAVRWFDAWL